jgi:hypothetical protein
VLEMGDGLVQRGIVVAHAFDTWRYGSRAAGIAGAAARAACAWTAP